MTIECARGMPVGPISLATVYPPRPMSKPGCQLDAPESWITDRMFPAGSLNQAIGGGYSRAMPRSSWPDPS